MTTNESQQACPICGGTDLEYGQGASPFMPRGRLVLFGYRVRNFVCLDCGYVGHYLDKRSVQDIQKKRNIRRRRTGPLHRLPLGSVHLHPQGGKALDAVLP